LILNSNKHTKYLSVMFPFYSNLLYLNHLAQYTEIVEVFLKDFHHTLKVETDWKSKNQNNSILKWLKKSTNPI